MPANRAVRSVHWKRFVRRSASLDTILTGDGCGAIMNSLLDRFCRYVRFDTQADEKATTYPSSIGQLELGRNLVNELQALGLNDATQDSHGIVLATIPPTIASPAPAIAWMAHLDTSPETTGHNVKPIVHRDYDGGDIILPG